MKKILVLFSIITSILISGCSTPLLQRETSFKINITQNDTPIYETVIKTAENQSKKVYLTQEAKPKFDISITHSKYFFQSLDLSLNGKIIEIKEIKKFQFHNGDKIEIPEYATQSIIQKLTLEKNKPTTFFVVSEMNPQINYAFQITLIDN